MVFLLIFVFVFFFITVLRRLFLHSYLWQIKEYRWDRMWAHIEEQNLLSLKSIPTVILTLLTIGAIILTRLLTIKWLYSVLLLGFAYFVYTTLCTLTDLLSNKLKRPKISIRNILIVIPVVVLSFSPLIGTGLFYKSLYKGSGSENQNGEGVNISIQEVFPKESQGIQIIPLETISLVIFFKYLFAFDLAVPGLVSLLVAVTSIPSSLTRKKKSEKPKKELNHSKG
jgi:hypothetical protein